MKSRKIAWPMHLPKKSAFAIETPPDINKLHALILFSGKRGGGKTVACVSYVKKLLDLHLMQRVLLITPTYNSNKELFAPLNLKPDDVLEPTIDVLKTVVRIVEEEKAEYDKYWEDVKKYKDLQRYLNSDTPVTGIPSDLLMMLTESTEPPKYKYPHCIANKHPPRLFLIIDDCMGTDVYKPRGGLTAFIIKHRHIAEGLGISVAMLVQTYAAANNAGVSRPIRENCTALCLFKSAAQHGSQLEKIHSEIGTDVDLEKFDRLFSYATSKPFGFLFVDFNPKTPEQQFRSGLNEYIW